MHLLRIVVIVAWAILGIFWFVSALGAKERSDLGLRRRIPLTAVTALVVLLLLRVFGGGSLGVHSVVLGALGVLLCLIGLALALWARVHLGRNWGMPMSEKAEPELITSGPYRFVRHPIYSGLLLAIVGTALVTNLLGLLVAVAMTGYFYYSASVEERNLTAAFPDAYPAYRLQTKMLIPFLL